MFVNEVISGNFGVYAAAVRVVLETFSVTTQTVIRAGSRQGAIAMLTRIYGVGNVLWVRELAGESLSATHIQRRCLNNRDRTPDMRGPRKRARVQVSCVSETEMKTRVLSPAELQVKAMSDRAQQYKKQAKAIKARQQLSKAQDKLRHASITLSNATI